MRFSQILKVLKSLETGRVQLARYLGISYMTMHRWKKKRDHKVPFLYEVGVREGIYRLIADQKLTVIPEAARSFLNDSTSSSFAAVVRMMGIDSDPLPSNSWQEKLETVLFEIGQNRDRRCAVEARREYVGGLKSLGSDWKRGITSLYRVLESEEVALEEKFVAYGALFYLCSPLTLVPRTLTSMGQIDVFGILCVAVSYYGRPFTSPIVDEILTECPCE